MTIKKEWTKLKSRDNLTRKEVKRLRSLKSIRADMKLTQEEFAKLVGISFSAYAKKEQGKLPLLARELREIAKVSKVDEKDIEVLK